MDLKTVQQQLKLLRDRIKSQGEISSDDEQELRSLISQTLETANDELEDIQQRLEKNVIRKKANDNIELTDEQKARLTITEKTGTGSIAVH